jgi:signal recognition particle subunit SRP54
MFEALSEKLSRVFRELRGQGRISEVHLEAAVRQIRIALLEADVNYKVVKGLIDRLKERAIGQEVVGSLSPSQQIVKIVYQELVAALGGTSAQLVLTRRVPEVVMLVGLQGSGKTTTAGKLARLLEKAYARRPLLVSTDVYRPAGRQQLSIIAKAVGQPVFECPDLSDPIEICRRAIRECRLAGYDALIVDTAGRLHIDDQLMEELVLLKREAEPSEILLVADAMTGQDAVRSAEEFHRRVGLTGVILTKMDGDARGGAALSIKEVTGQPIKLIGTGERYDALEVFYPDRIAQRILGMGDVLSLIEKVQAEVDQQKAAKLGEKLLRDQFTLEDYLDQLRQMKRLGSLDKILDLLPSGLFGALRVTPERVAEIERKLKLTEAIINSMTPGERRDHSILNASRRRRIARGSGTSIREVNQVISEYEQMRRLMRMVTSGRLGGLFGRQKSAKKKKPNKKR